MRGLPLVWRAGRWGRCEGGSGRASASRCPRCRRYGTPAKGRHYVFSTYFYGIGLVPGGSLEGADLCSQAAVGTHSAEGEQGLQEGRGQLPANTETMQMRASHGSELTPPPEPRSSPCDLRGTAPWLCPRPGIPRPPRLRGRRRSIRRKPPVSLKPLKR